MSGTSIIAQIFVPLTGHFQSFFYFYFFYRAFFIIIFINISRKNSKTSEVNFNLYIFHHFTKNLDRTITFNSVTLKNARTEPQKKIQKKFNQTNNI